jgi:retinol dehydrogenase-12
MDLPFFKKQVNPPGGWEALRGKISVVTGANSGIGFEAAKALASAGSKVVMVCRSEVRGTAAVETLKKAVPEADLELELVDLGSLTSVRAGAKALAARHPQLHVLVNNAGVWSYYRRESADGLEMTWATNQLGPFLFTELLLPQLRAAGQARIVNVASGLARDLHMEDPEFRQRRYVGLDAYAQSKQANRMWTWGLARRLAGSGVTANAVHPGFVKTGAFGKGGGWQGMVADMGVKLLGSSPAQGADTVAWLAISKDMEGTSGRFWKDRRELDCPYRDPAQVSQLWSLCERSTGAVS